ncbi:MAG: hypothetical protein SOW45_07695 [Prevotella sp.]|nr:hypothetical protein [Prevotella sp.]
MKTNHTIPMGTLVLFSVLALFGCRKSDVRQPDVPVEVVVSAMVQLEDAKGSVIRTADAGDAQMVKEVVSLTGQGKYKVGETAKIATGVKEDYTLLGYYFRYTKDYDSKRYPIDRAKLLKANADGGLAFVVQADITVIAVVQKKEALPTPGEPKEDDEPLIQKEPFRLIPSVDVRYWKEQNQKAWDMIYPKIVRLSEEEEWEMIERYDWDLMRLHPELEEVLHTDTIYSGETNLISYWINIRQARAAVNRDPSQAIRMAYALADKSGNIVQIYPPFRQDTSGKNVSYPVYVDLPEGDYTQKVLIQIPEDPDKWYDLRLHDTLKEYQLYGEFYRIKEKIDKNERFYKYLPTLPNPNSYFVYYKLPKDLLWWNDETITRHVVERKTVDEAPIPGWTNTHFFNPDGTEMRYGVLANMGLKKNDGGQLKMNLSNKSNAYRRGTVHAVVVRKTWIAQNKDILEKIWEVCNSRSAGSADNRVEEIREAGKVDVTFRGEESKEVSIDLYCPQGPNGEVSLPGCNYYLVFYWQPEGESKLYFMTQNFSKVLNRLQERIDVPFGEFWAGSNNGVDDQTRNIDWLDGTNNYQPIIGPNVLYEEFQTWLNGNGILI